MEGREHGSGTRVEGMYLRMQYDELSFLSRLPPSPVPRVEKGCLQRGGHVRTGSVCVYLVRGTCTSVAE